MADLILQQDPSLAPPATPTIRRAAILVGETPTPGTVGATSASSEQSRAAMRVGADLGDAVLAHGGRVFAVRGSASYASFPSATDAAAAAAGLLRTLASVPPELLPRIAIDVGDVAHAGRDDHASGPPVARSSRLAGLASYGQILLSSEAVDELTRTDGSWVLRGLGAHLVDGGNDVTVVHQLDVEGLPTTFPPLGDRGRTPPVPDPPPSAPGYEVREVVGRNSDGVVHVGYQPSIGREVAITAVRADQVDEPEFVRRFEIDAHVIAHLEHPHIVPLYDYWREPGSAYLVARGNRGGTLGDAEDRDWSTDDLTRLVDDVGQALAYAQLRGVVPASLGPDDVLLDEQGGFHIGSFGIGGPVSPITDRGPHGPVRCLAELVDRLAVVLPEPLRRLVRSQLDEPELDIAAFLDAWHAAADQDAAVPAPRGPSPARNPFKGLASFDEVDAADFFGRDDLVEDVVAALTERPIATVVGPSGIGKSSLVKAGVIPRLRAGAVHGSEAWLVADLVPGSDPFGAVAAAVRRFAIQSTDELDELLRDDARGLLRAIGRYLPADATVLLVVDQFEELFTQTNDTDEQSAFLDMLVAGLTEVGTPLRVIATIRADHFDLPLQHGAFGAIMRWSTVVVHGPTGPQLREMITAPATHVGVQVENAAVEQIVADVQAQPGALPLLEFTLTELFDEDESSITRAGYEASGRITGTIARRAEATISELSQADHETARQLFLRMVAVGDHAVTRRRVRLVDLRRSAPDPASLSRVLEAFGAGRLLTFDRDRTTRTPTVELAHEALISGWPRLSQWISDVREDLLLHQRLRQATDEWLSNDRAPGFLLRGGRLSQHEAWTTTTNLQLAAAERDLLEASRDREDDERGRRRRRRRITTSVIASAAAIAMVLAGLAWSSRNDAARQRDVADARRLLASSAEVLDRDPELALLLATEAAERLVGDPEAAAALHTASAANRTLRSLTWPVQGARNTQVDMTDDGATMVWAGQPGGLVELRDIESGEVHWQHDFGENNGGDLIVRPRFVSQDREVLVTVQFSPGENDRARQPPPGSVGVHVLDATSGELVRRLPSTACGAWGAAGGVSWAAVVSEDGEDHAIWNQYTSETIEEQGCPQLGSTPATIDIVRADVQTGELIRIATDQPATGVIYSALSHDGQVAAYDPVQGPRRVVDIASGEVLLSLPDTQAEGPVALSADGALVAVSSPEQLRQDRDHIDQHRTAIYDVATGEHLATTTGHEQGVQLFKARFSLDGQVLYTSSADGTVRIWEVESGKELDRVTGVNAPFTEPRLSRDRTRLLAASFSPEARAYDLTPGGRPEVASHDPCGQGDMVEPAWNRGGVSVRGGHLLIHVSCDGVQTPPRALVIDRATGDVVSQVPAMGHVVAHSDDGQLVAARDWTSQDGSIWAGQVVVHDLDAQAEEHHDGLCAWDWGALSQAQIRAYELAPAADPSCRSAPDTPVLGANDELVISPDNRFVALALGGAEGSHILVSEVGSGRLRAVLRGDRAAFVPSRGEVIVYDFVDRRLVAYDLDEFTELREHVASDLPLVEDLMYAPGQGDVIGLATNLGDARILRFDIETLQPSGEITEAHEAEVLDMDVNEALGLLATGGADGRARVWDLTSG